MTRAPEDGGIYAWDEGTTCNMNKLVDAKAIPLRTSRVHVLCLGWIGASAILVLPKSETSFHSTNAPTIPSRTYNLVHLSLWLGLMEIMPFAIEEELIRYPTAIWAMIRMVSIPSTWGLVSCLHVSFASSSYSPFLTREITPVIFRRLAGYLSLHIAYVHSNCERPASHRRG
jgi:hypothetical protein